MTTADLRAAYTRVRTLVAGVLDVPVASIDDEARLGESGWTSLTHLTILLTASQEYEFALDAELVQRLTSVAALAEHVDGRRWPS